MISQDKNSTSINANLNTNLSTKEQQRLEKLCLLQEQLALDLKERFKESITAFKEFMPDVASAFENYRPKKALHFFCTENGIPNLEFPDDDHRILYGCDNPWESIDKELDEHLAKIPLFNVISADQNDPYGQIHLRYLKRACNTTIELTDNHGKFKLSTTPNKTKAIGNAIILGSGLGYAIGLLYSKVEVANLLIVEPDPDLFYASLHTFDWAPLLQFVKDEDLGFKLIVGQDPDNFLKILGEFFDRHGRFLSGQLWPYVGRSGEDIKKCAECIKLDFKRMHANMGFFDDTMFGCSHALQSALAGKHFVKRQASLPPKMRRYPLFVIGNGPSLDKDMAFLRKNQDKAIIIACGTALDTLYHAGIKPDFYAATERTPEIAETIEAIPDKDFINSLTLIAGDVIHPKTTACFKRTAIFGRANEPFYWIWQTHVEKDKRIREIDIMNPLVGNLGVASIFGFGFNESYLFGLDCGKKIDADMHSKYSTIYNERGLGDSEVYKINDKYHLKGNFGGTIQSTYFMEMCARNMEIAIADHMYYQDEIFKIYNCSDGALIKGTIPLHTENLDFDNRPLINKQELLDYVENSFTFKAEITRAQIHEYCMVGKFSEIIANLKKMISDFPTSRTAAVKWMMTMSEYILSLQNHPFLACLGHFIDGTIQSILLQAFYTLYQCIDEKKAIDATKKVLQSLDYFFDDAKRLYPLLPDYVLGEHYKFTDNKIGFDHEEDKAPPSPAYPHLFKEAFDDPVKKFHKRYA